MDRSNRRSTIIPGPPRHSTTGMMSSKPRQYAHLQSQLTTLQANLADLEELLRMTTTQAENVKTLGGLMGGFFMASSKVFEESDGRTDAATAASAAADMTASTATNVDDDSQ